MKQKSLHRLNDRGFSDETAAFTPARTPATLPYILRLCGLSYPASQTYLTRLHGLSSKIPTTVRLPDSLLRVYPSALPRRRPQAFYITRAPGTYVQDVNNATRRTTMEFTKKFDTDSKGTVTVTGAVMGVNKCPPFSWTDGVYSGPEQVLYRLEANPLDVYGYTPGVEGPSRAFRRWDAFADLVRRTFPMATVETEGRDDKQPPGTLY